jgi:hypothetical protein
MVTHNLATRFGSIMNHSYARVTVLRNGTCVYFTNKNNLRIFEKLLMNITYCRYSINIYIHTYKCIYTDAADCSI